MGLCCGRSSREGRKRFQCSVGVAGSLDASGFGLREYRKDGFLWSSIRARLCTGLFGVNKALTRRME
ncbi:hypothetical protein AAC387_Pa07g0406 [Persea americana]